MTDKLKAWQLLLRFTASYSSSNCGRMPYSRHNFSEYNKNHDLTKQNKRKACYYYTRYTLLLVRKMGHRGCNRNLN